MRKRSKFFTSYVRIHIRQCPNISSTPLRQWDFWQCLTFSWTTLRGKHCWHPIAVIGVVDTFGQWYEKQHLTDRWGKPPHLFVQCCISLIGYCLVSRCYDYFFLFLSILPLLNINQKMNLCVWNIKIWHNQPGIRGLASKNNNSSWWEKSQKVKKCQKNNKTLFEKLLL